MTDADARPGDADDAFLTLAFYIVVDVSLSMRSNGAIEAASQILPTVVDAVRDKPGNTALADVVRLGVMDFSDDAKVVLGLSDLRDVNHIPQLAVRGGTSYAAAFRLLRQEIERDVKQLKADGMRVYRPAVFFITDGAPTDDAASLQTAFAELTDKSFRFRPNIIPFGVGDATKEALDPWVFPKDGSKPMRSYLNKSADPAAAINQVAEILISSILASADSVSTIGSGGGFVPPDDEDLDDDEWM